MCNLSKQGGFFFFSKVVNGYPEAQDIQTQSFLQKWRYCNCNWHSLIFFTFF